jgi:ribosomal protein L37E
MAAHFWAAQRRWDKCLEIGAPAVEALDVVLHTSPKWRDRIAAAGTLAALGQTRPAPCARLDLVQQALDLLEGEGDAETKRASLEAFLAEHRQFNRRASEEVAWCDCGYPAARIRKDGLQELMSDLLAFEKTSGNVTTYYCPSCGTRRASLAA